MAMKIGAAALAIAILVVFLQGSIFGGGDDEPLTSLARRGSIPTATPPANLPEPILLGESRGGTTAAVQAGGEGTYAVKSGDTLAGIAASLGVPGDQQAAWVAEILRLNGIADVRLLTVGQSLRLPRIATPTATPRGAAATAATPTRPASPQATAASSTPAVSAAGATPPATTPTPRPTVAASGGGGGTYTVAEGDFALLIAEKLGVPAAQQDAWAQQLLALNNLCSTCLQAGQVIQLPAGTPSGGAAPPPTSTRAP